MYLFTQQQFQCRNCGGRAHQLLPSLQAVVNVVLRLELLEESYVHIAHNFDTDEINLISTQC